MEAIVVVAVKENAKDVQEDVPVGVMDPASMVHIRHVKCHVCQ